MSIISLFKRFIILSCTAFLGFTLQTSAMLSSQKTILTQDYEQELAKIERSGNDLEKSSQDRLTRLEETISYYQETKNQEARRLSYCLSIKDDKSVLKIKKLHNIDLILPGLLKQHNSTAEILKTMQADHTQQYYAYLETIKHDAKDGSIEACNALANLFETGSKYINQHHKTAKAYRKLAYIYHQKKSTQSVVSPPATPPVTPSAHEQKSTPTSTIAKATSNTQATKVHTELDPENSPKLIIVHDSTTGAISLVISCLDLAEEITDTNDIVAEHEQEEIITEESVVHEPEEPIAQEHVMPEPVIQSLTAQEYYDSAQQDIEKNNIQQAQQNLEKAIEASTDDTFKLLAFRKLAEILQKPGTSKAIKKALPYWAQAADLGDLDAAILVANSYKDTQEKRADARRYFDMIINSPASNDTQKANALYSRATITQEKAIKADLMMRAAQLNHSQACYWAARAALDKKEYVQATEFLDHIQQEHDPIEINILRNKIRESNPEYLMTNALEYLNQVDPLKINTPKDKQLFQKYIDQLLYAGNRHQGNLESARVKILEIFMEFVGLYNLHSQSNEYSTQKKEEFLNKSIEYCEKALNLEYIIEYPEAGFSVTITLARIYSNDNNKLKDLDKSFNYYSKLITMFNQIDSNQRSYIIKKHTFNSHVGIAKIIKQTNKNFSDGIKHLLHAIDLAHAIKHEPEDKTEQCLGSVYYMLAEFYEKTEQFTEALAAYKNGAEYNHPGSYLKIGDIYRQPNNYQKFNITGDPSINREYGLESCKNAMKLNLSEQEQSHLSITIKNLIQQEILSSTSELPDRTDFIRYITQPTQNFLK